MIDQAVHILDEDILVQQMASNLALDASQRTLSTIWEETHSWDYAIGSINQNFDQWDQDSVGNDLPELDEYEEVDNGHQNNGDTK